MRTAALIFIFVLSTFFGIAQTKEISASRTTEKINIDGLDTEAAWQSAEIATGFLELNPTEGNPPKERTEVKILYDDNNLYILGYCYDRHPDSILTQLGERDDRLNSDLFTVSFDPYNKALDAFIFSVTASGVQGDERISDPLFNAVWESAVSIVEDGWIAEIQIPYYAIRFPKSGEQLWRINFQREIRRSRTQLQWALVPKEVETELNYWGYLKGLDDIKDPLRLSLSPYISTFAESYRNESTLGYGAGADMKLGLNESFTLDVTLLPDFSQVQSDNIVKNLSAFEVVFEEQRPFFQEGVELFNLGDLFYSRRIGGVPQSFQNAFSAADSNESLTDNPSLSPLVNVAKVSGRNINGLGIGVMNAVTAETRATIKNNETGTSRTVVTNPLVNYNIVSFDQNLKNNSSVYFINLNTLRGDTFIDGNVTSAGFNLISGNSTYSVSGNMNISQRDTNLWENFLSADEGDGVAYTIGFAKIKGNFKFALSSESKSPNYDPNDLGVNFTTNIRTHFLELQYNKYNPFWKLNNSYNTFEFSMEQDYTTGELLRMNYSGRFFQTTPKFHSFIFRMSSQIGDGIDLFESRVPGQKFVVPEFYYNSIGISSDYRRAIALDGFVGYGHGYFTDYVVNNYFEAELAPILRVNDQLILTPSSNYSVFLNGAGFAGFFEGTPKYGVRDVRTLTNIIQGKYLFKNNLALTLRMRHYWSYGEYDYYGDLDEDGYIIPDAGFTGDADFNFNAFNTDLIFTWQFAAGSFINVVYKNNLERDENNILVRYYDNLETILEQDQRHTLTFKLIYFLDAVSTYRKITG